VAVIANDGMDGGSNFNALSVTAETLAQNLALSFAYTNVGNEKVMRRTPPDPIDEDVDDLINTVAHEFGHSFNLGDEYEDVPGDAKNAGRNYDGSDNLAGLDSINLDANYLTDRLLDPSKVKWFDLLRIEVADTLTRASDTDAASGQLRVTIPRGNISRWVQAKNQHQEAFLRWIQIPASGQQFPLPVDDAHYAVRLQIGDIDEANGTILLGGPELPTPMPTYPPGSLLFIPKRDASGQLMFVVEHEVLGKLTATHLPLNQDTNHNDINDGADYPVDISGFKPPCKSYKLIGVYEGGGHSTGMIYRPTGLCKMRKSSDAGVGDGEFCYVCKYLIVNRVDPSLHGILDHNCYPKAKKNG
jgi:hypothetical protein